MEDALKNLEKETEKRAEKLRLALSAYRLQTVALLEAIHASARVHQLLLASEERMALGANFNSQFRLGGAGLKRFTADAANRRLLILRMDALFHLFHLSAWLSSI